MMSMQGSPLAQAPAAVPPAPVNTRAALLSIQIQAAQAAVTAAQTRTQMQSASLAAQIAALQSRISALSGASTTASQSTYNQPFVPLCNAQSPGGPRSVILHYQASCRAGGGSVAGYVTELQHYRAMGVDMIGLDMGDSIEPYLTNTTNLFAAANQINTANKGALNNMSAGDIKLFIQFDCATFAEDPARLSAFFLRFARDPAYATYAATGKPIFSTYAGEGGTWVQVKSVWSQTLSLCRAGGVSPWFMPGFAPTNPDGSYGCQDLPDWAAWLKTFADGAWIYPSGASPLSASSGIGGQEQEAKSVRGAGLVWIGSAMPAYWGAGHGIYRGDTRFYNEFGGGEGLSAQMMSHLDANPANAPPAMLELATANDYDEGSNFSSIDPNLAWPYLQHGSIPGFYKSKLGLQAEARYYIQWYKTGQRPVIADDTIIAYYRTQTGALAPSADPLGPITSVQNPAGDPPGLSDTIYVTALLKASGIVQVSVGGITAQRFAPAGVSHLRFPLAAGTPQFVLLRSGNAVLQMAGEPIVSAAVLVNANYFTCVSHPGLQFVLSASDSQIPADSAGLYSRTSGAQDIFGAGSLRLSDLATPSLPVQYLTALAPYNGTAAVSFSPPPPLFVSPSGALRPSVGIAAPLLGFSVAPNSNGIYWSPLARAPSAHWSASVDITAVNIGAGGRAGVALVSSTGAPQANTYFGAAYVAYVEQYAAGQGALHLQKMTNVTNETGQTTTELMPAISVNTTSLGETSRLTLEDNAGVLTATLVPGNQQP